MILLDTLKSHLIRHCKLTIQSKIFEQYPVITQLNFHGNVKKEAEGQNVFDSKKADMIAFINVERDGEDLLTEAISALEDTSIFDEFPRDLGKAKEDFGFDDVDAWMCEFVDKKMPSLINDSQRLMVAVGLQSAAQFDHQEDLENV